MKIPSQKFFSSLLAVGLMLALTISGQDAAVTPNAPGPATNETSRADSAQLADSNSTAVVETNVEPPVNESPHWERPRQIVLFGQNAELKAGETADVIVVIGGSAKVHGKVRDACVVIGGDLEVDGEVGDATVAVLGNLSIGSNARIHHDAVAVLGNNTIAAGAKVGGDAVSVGGKLDLADSASVRGEKVNVGLPFAFPKIDWLAKWVRYCVFEMRPLAPQVGWVWAVAGVFFLLYLLIAAILPRPVQVSLDTLTQRPATTFLVGLLAKLLSPLVILVLIATGVGIIVVPFVSAALFFAAIIGKVALLEWLGLQLGRHFGWQKPLLAFLIGSVIITLLYMVPVLGMLTYMIFSIWGLGCATTAAFASMRREKADRPTAQPPAYPSAPAPAMTALAPGSNPISPAMFAAATPLATGAAPIEQPIPPNIPATAPLSAPKPIAPLSAQPPAFSTAMSLPRAGFWERMGAAFLDLVLLFILTALLTSGHRIPPPVVFAILSLAYFSGLWTWKGTTIGGIVLKLQVVRHDGGQLNFLVALVRGLAAAFSALVLFLGFFWIGWDRDKQGWHDKIAGTFVVRLPRSMPLVCL